MEKKELETSRKTPSVLSTMPLFDEWVSSHNINWAGVSEDYAVIAPKGGWQPMPVVQKRNRKALCQAISEYEGRKRTVKEAGEEAAKSLADGLRMLDLLKSYGKAGQMSEEDMILRLKGYQAVLADVSLHAVRQAIVDYAGSTAGYPDVAEIKGMAERIQQGWEMILHRLKILEKNAEWNGGVAQEIQADPVKVDEVPQEEKERVASGMTSLAKMLQEYTERAENGDRSSIVGQPVPGWNA